MGFETAWLVLTLFVVAFGLIFALQAFDDVNDDIQADTTLSAEAKSFSEEAVGNAPTRMDNVFLFLFIGLWAVLIVGAYMSASNPIMTFIAIILGIIGLVVIIILGNAYAEAVSDDETQEFAENFPKMSWILNNLLVMAVFITFSVILVMYATNS